jgi:hypothetical protein
MASPPHPAAMAESYSIGVSNTVQGNGWREQMICAMKAEALASGKVDRLNIAHRNTDAAGQLEDIRNLIEAGVDAIVVNPSNPDGAQLGDQGSDGCGHRRRRGRPGGDRAAYILSNNQEEYAYLGAKWLFEQMGGEGRGRLHARRRRRLGRQRPRQRASSARWPSSRASASCTRSTPAGSRTRASSRSTTSSPRASPSTASGPAASTT